MAEQQNGSRNAREAPLSPEVLRALLLEHGRTLLAILAPDGRILQIAGTCRDIVERPAEELEGHAFFELVPADEHDAVFEALQTARNEQHPTRVCHRLYRGRLRLRWCESMFIPIEAPDGRKLIHVSCTDISTQRRRAELLETSQVLFHAVLEAAGDAIIAFDEESHVLLFNRAAEHMFGHPSREMMGESIERLFPELSAREMVFGALEAGGSTPDQQLLHRIELVARRKDGRTFPAEVAIAHEAIGNRDVYTVIVRDVTDRKRMERELDRLAHYDEVTELPNRITLLDRLGQAVRIADRQRSPLSLLFIDLDGFKEVNDDLGHQKGDELLWQVARRLESSVRASDTVARLSGDEFVLVLNGTHQQDAERIVQTILPEIARPFDLSGHKVHITASIGASFYPRDGTAPGELLRHADMAMYQAKRRGKNRYALSSGGE